MCVTLCICHGMCHSICHAVCVCDRLHVTLQDLEKLSAHALKVWAETGTRALVHWLESSASINNSSSGGMHYDESLPAPNGQISYSPVPSS